MTGSSHSVSEVVVAGERPVTEGSPAAVPSGVANHTGLELVNPTRI